MEGICWEERRGVGEGSSAPRGGGGAKPQDPIQLRKPCCVNEPGRQSGMAGAQGPGKGRRCLPGAQRAQERGRRMKQGPSAGRLMADAVQRVSQSGSPHPPLCAPLCPTPARRGGGAQRGPAEARFGWAGLAGSGRRPAPRLRSRPPALPGGHSRSILARWSLPAGRSTALSSRLPASGATAQRELGTCQILSLSMRGDFWLLVLVLRGAARALIPHPRAGKDWSRLARVGGQVWARDTGWPWP